MKKRILFLGILAIALTFSFIVSSCDNISNRETSVGDVSLSSALPSVRFVMVTFDITSGVYPYELQSSRGVISIPDDSYVMTFEKTEDNNYTIMIDVWPEDTYLNIRWHGHPINQKDIYLRAILPLISDVSNYTIKINYNNSLTTQNLINVVSGTGDEVFNSNISFANDFDAAVYRNDALNIKTINVKFDVRNGGIGMLGSNGIVSTQDDNSLFVRDGNIFANDFTITISIPKHSAYVNIRWCCILDPLGDASTYVTGKLPLDRNISSYTIILDYYIVKEEGIYYNAVNAIGLDNFHFGSAENAPRNLTFGHTMEEDFDIAWNRAIDD